MKSKNFDKIKDYFDKGMWGITRVYNLVGKKLGITKEEFETITGVSYEDFNP